VLDGVLEVLEITGIGQRRIKGKGEEKKTRRSVDGV
jgi:hypothetical protein